MITSSFDEDAFVVVDRHIVAAGLPSLPRPDTKVFRRALASRIAIWMRDPASHSLLREMLAELQAFLVKAMPEQLDGSESPETVLRSYFPAIVLEMTTDEFHLLLSLCPPESPRHRTLMDAQQAEYERRQRDESGY